MARSNRRGYGASSGVRNASEIVGTTFSSRRRLAQNAASMSAFDRVGVRWSREAGLAALLRVSDMARKMVLDSRRDGVRRRIGRSAHRPRERRVDLGPGR
jgi:hypothetical protein